MPQVGRMNRVLASEQISPISSVRATASLRSSTQRRLRVVLAGDLDTIALKALKKHPAERYPSVRQDDAVEERSFGAENPQPRLIRQAVDIIRADRDSR